jgi:hypothetical protein
MKTKRSRDFSAFRTSVKDALSACECYKSTSLHTSEKIQQLAERYNVPNYLWQWAWGYRDAVVDRWYRHNLVFCYKWEGQLLPANWDKMPESFKDFARSKSTSEMDCGHYWKAEDGTLLENRPFFTK